MTRHDCGKLIVLFYVLACLLVAAMLCATARGGEPILLDFSASWCKPCREMRPILNQLSKDGYDVRIIDCDKGVPEDWSLYRIRVLPTFVIIRDRLEVARIEGMTSSAQLRRALGEVPVRNNYQGVNSETMWRSAGSAPAGFISGSYTFPPVAEAPAGLSETHTDIMRNVPPGKSLRAKYERQGVVTWAHEDVHVINSVWSRSLGPRIWAFYMGNGNAWALREPNISKRLVEQKTPETLRRGRGWQLYMTGANPDQPFVILDEWVAYIASAQVANELYGAAETRPISVVTNGPITDTTLEVIIDRDSAVEFAGYATILLRCIEAYEPTYPDLERLREFVSINLQRTMDVQSKPVTVAYQRYFQQFNPNCGPPQYRVIPGEVKQGAIYPPTGVQVEPKPPLVAVPLKPQPTQPAAPSNPCNCSGEGACKCDPSKACGCDLSKLAQCKCDGKDTQALQDRILVLEATVAKLENCKCKSQDDAATRPGLPAYFDIEPRKRK